MNKNNFFTALFLVCSSLMIYSITASVGTFVPIKVNNHLSVDYNTRLIIRLSSRKLIEITDTNSSTERASTRKIITPSGEDILIYYSFDEIEYFSPENDMSVLEEAGAPHRRLPSYLIINGKVILNINPGTRNWEIAEIPIVLGKDNIIIIDSKSRFKVKYE